MAASANELKHKLFKKKRKTKNIVANFSKFLSVRFALRLVSPEGAPWLALRGQKIF